MTSPARIPKRRPARRACRVTFPVLHGEGDDLRRLSRRQGRGATDTVLWRQTTTTVFNTLTANDRTRRSDAGRPLDRVPPLATGRIRMLTSENVALDVLQKGKRDLSPGTSPCPFVQC